MALVLLKEFILLLGEIVGFQRDLELVFWLWRRLRMCGFGLVDCLEEVELVT